jgi:multimeric flavodoxin WrbA
MHNILVLEGSPRVGNTSLVTDWVLAGIGRGVKIERVRVCDMAVHECQECFTCTKSKKAPGCAQDDEMVDLYDRIIDADLVLWTSPIFCWGITGQLKVVLDRCFALLTGEDLLKGSKWALVLTSGGDHFDGADLAVQMFSRLARFGGMKYLGQYAAANCPDGAKLRRDKSIQEHARSFGRELEKALRSG